MISHCWDRIFPGSIHKTSQLSLHAPSIHYVVSVAQNLVQKTNGYIVTYNSSKEKLESLKQDKIISSQVG
jgi:hypothetical protein